MNSRDWSLVKSADDRAAGTGGKRPEPSAGAPDARALPAAAPPLPRQAVPPAPGKRRAAGAWPHSDRVPARGFMLAIPAGVALWALAIYLIAWVI